MFVLYKTQIEGERITVKKVGIFKFMIVKMCTQRMYVNIRGSLNKFPDFFRMGTFIDRTHMRL